MTAPCTAALYLRVSKEDTDASGPESTSIAGQRLVLLHFLRSHPEFSGWQVEEYADDGCSGKTLRRPAFQRLLERVRAGAVSCILVKDFSRFSRDYIALGTALEETFPLWGTRFISVTEHYDSLKEGGRLPGLEEIFRRLTGDYYTRDTSRKLKALRQTMAENGQFSSPYAPYGYRKSPENRHTLIPDPETAPVVRQIFRLRGAGASGPEIARILNRKQIPSPAACALARGTRDWRQKEGPMAWEPSKILSILKDERYTGTLVSLRRACPGIRSPGKPVPQEKWVEAPGSHPPILSQAEFMRIQETFHSPETRSPSSPSAENPWVCGQCHRKLSLSRDGKKYICRFGSVNPQSPCWGRSYPAQEMEGILFILLRWELRRSVSMKKVAALWLTNQVPGGRPREKRGTTADLDQKETRLYEKLCQGLLEKDGYIREKKKLRLEKARRREEIRKWEEARLRAEELKAASVPSVLDDYREAGPRTQRKLLAAFVREVQVLPGPVLTVTWKFSSPGPDEQVKNS